MDFYGNDWEAHIEGTAVFIFINNEWLYFYSQASIIEAKAIIKSYCPGYSVLKAVL